MFTHTHTRNARSRIVFLSRTLKLRHLFFWNLSLTEMRAYLWSNSLTHTHPLTHTHMHTRTQTLTQTHSLPVSSLTYKAHTLSLLHPSLTHFFLFLSLSLLSPIKLSLKAPLTMKKQRSAAPRTFSRSLGGPTTATSTSNSNRTRLVLFLSFHSFLSFSFFI